MTWLTTPLQWLGASPVVAYNVLFIVTPWLNGIAAYALMIALTGRRDAAVAGAAYFAFAPYRAVQLSHIQTTATFFMPLALLGLHRFFATGRWTWIALLTVASALNGLVSGYHLLYFAVAFGLAWLWLGIGARDWRRSAAALGGFAISMLALAPILLVYRRVHSQWDLKRGLGEMAFFSADLVSGLSASSNLVAWRLPGLFDKPEGEMYPGIVMMTVVVGGLVLLLRREPLPRAHTSRIVELARLALWTLAGLGVAAAVVRGVAGPQVLAVGPLRISITEVFKPLGLALNAAVVATALSPRWLTLAQHGSVLGLYAALFIVTAILMLGPEGQVLGVAFWYKAPFAWLVELPGFDAVRVPARLALVQVLAGAALVSLVLARLLPVGTRRTSVLCAVVTVACMVDGWFRLPVVPAPPWLPVTTAADLLIELPTAGWAEDVPAMYRGAAHGRPVINGYSGYLPPHYPPLIVDVTHGCFDSLEHLRRGRSLDVVVWIDRDRDRRLRQQLAARWPDAPRAGAPGVEVFRIPATQDRAESAYDDPIDLSGFCEAARASATDTP